MTKQQIDSIAYKRRLEILMELYLDLSDLDTKRKLKKEAINNQLTILKRLREAKGQKTLP